MRWSLLGGCRIVVALAALGSTAAAMAQLVHDPDINNDGIVNAIDLGVLRECFFVDPAGVPACGVADFNADGVINAIDLGSLRQRFFDTMPTPLEASGLYDYLRLPVGSAPFTVAADDLDADGDIDLVAATVGTLSVLWSRGNGSFEQRTLPGSSNPVSVRVSHMNTDGVLDLVVIDSQDHAVLVYLGLGGAEFAAPVVYGVPPGPGWLEIADVNADGHADVLTAHFANNTGTTVLLNDGGGALSIADQVPVWDLATSVATCDLDQDGHLDLVMSGFAGFELFLAFGASDGTFSPAQSLYTGYQFTVHCIDLNADQIADLVTAANGAIVRLGDGQGGFLPAVQYDTTFYARSVTVEDINADGVADLMTENRDEGSVSVMTGLGSGLFADPVTSYIGGGGYFPKLADVSGDGLLDLVATNTASNSLQTVPGDGTGRFSPTVETFATGPAPKTVATFDLNGDGFDDVLTANASNDDVSILLSTGDGRLGAPLSLPIDREPDTVTVVDLDADGQRDLVVTTAGYGFVVLYGSGGLGFETGVRFGEPEPFSDIAIADFNNDGLLDIAGARTYRNLGNLVLATGARSFSAPLEVDFAGGSHRLVAADFNDDAAADLAALDTYEDTVSIVLGAGDATFSAPLVLPVGDYPVSIVSDDFNRDGLSDLAVAARTVHVLLGDGQGSFASDALLMPSSSGPLDVSTADLNGDGYADLMTRNASHDISVYLGNGDGGFQAPAAYPAFAGPAALGDLNGDQRLDVVTTDAAASAVTVLLQR